MVNERTGRGRVPNRRDTSRKRQSILDAAILEFRDKGYEGSSMDRIAELAGASKRTVYNHFPSKDQLLQAVIDRFGQEMHARKLVRYDPARSLEEQLSEFADAELAVAEDPTWMGFIKVLLTVFIRNPELARRAVAKQEGIEGTMVVWMRDAARDGRLSIDDAAMAARVFSAMLGGAITWPAVYQGYLDRRTTKALKEELVQTFLSRYRR